jgi:hypothetical protein
VVVLEEITVFFDVTMCNLIETNASEKPPVCFLRVENGDRSFCRQGGNYLADYTIEFRNTVTFMKLVCYCSAKKCYSRYDWFPWQETSWPVEYVSGVLKIPSW